MWPILSIIILAFGAGAVFGAPWVPAFTRDIDELLDLTHVKNGTQLIDLGCGNGKILQAAARRGAVVTGYEINPFLWAIAWLRMLPFGNRAHVRLGSYWGHDLKNYDVIWLYLIDHYMPKMAEKLATDASPRTYVISYIFEFPHIRPSKKTRNSTIYRGRSFKPANDRLQ